MSLHLRQICFATRDFDATRARFAEIFGAPPCFSDPDVALFGLENALFQIGTDFLEIVSPTGPKAPINRFLDHAGGDAGYMLIAQTESRDAQDAIRRRAEASGIRVAWEMTHRGADFLQWNPADTGGAFLETSFDHAGEPRGHWSAAGGLIGLDNRLRLLGATVTTPEPEAVARRWAALTGCPLDETASRLDFAGKSVTFRAPDAARPRTGITDIALHVPEPGALLARAAAAGAPAEAGGFDLCGVRIAVSG